MLDHRLGPRLPHLAVVFAAGILMASRGAGATLAPALWVAGALVAATAIPRRAGAARLLAVVFLVAGARAALDPLPPMTALTAVSGVDDRGLDELRGTVEGPVVDRPGRRSFVVVDHGLAVLVTARDPVPDVLPGDRVELLGRLRTPRGYRVPGAADLRQAVDRRGATHTMAVDGAAVRVVGRGGSWWRGPAQAQRLLAAAVAARAGDPAGNAVVRAMVLGGRGGLDPVLDRRFRDAGVSHVLAVSGLHLAVITWLVFLVVRRSWGAWPALALRVDADLAAALAAAPAAVGYAFVTGARVSTLRALLVVLLVLFGIVVSRRAHILDALGLAALALLAADPKTLFDPGFQLSFAATATLVLGLPRRAIRHRSAELSATALARGLARRGVELARASLWATLATAPLVAAWFGEVASGGVVANLVVVPLATLVILPLGLAGSLLAPIWPGGGGVLIDLSVVAAGWSVECAAAVGDTFPVVAVPPPTSFELCAAFLVWVAAICWVRGRWRATAAALVVTLGLASWAGSWLVASELAPRARRQLEVTFLDVGDGDATVLELPGGAVWLIDSGGLPFTPPGAEVDLAASPGERAVARFLAHRRIRRLDLVILSHPHPDHYAGLRALLDRIEIGEVWVARPHLETPPDVDYRALLVELAIRGVVVTSPPIGQVVWDHGVTLRVLHPRYLDAVAATDPVRSTNDNSLVVVVERAGRRLLFAADVEQEGEEILVAHHRDQLAAAVVKVPHHGSKTSSSLPFVVATAPRWAVISCGVANRYGTPAAAVVERWQAAGATVLRTDRDGSITVSVAEDGALSVTTFDGAAAVVGSGRSGVASP